MRRPFDVTPQEDRFRAATGEGLLGTGTFLLGVRAMGSHEREYEYEAEAWFLVLFVPLLPRGVWRLRSSDPQLGALRWEPRCFDLVRHGARPIEPRGLLARWGRSLAILGAALAPAAWTFLRIEQTGVLPAIRLVGSTLLPLYAIARLDYALVRVRRAA